MHSVFDRNTPCLMSVIKPSFILSFTGQVWHLITGEAHRGDTIKLVVEMTRQTQGWHKKGKKTLRRKKNRNFEHLFFSLSLFTESLINLSGILTALAPPYAASALKRVLCLFAVKCDQAPHMINEAFAGNVRGGDQAQGRNSSCFALSGKQNLCRRVSFSFRRRGMMNGLLSAVRRSTFISAFFFFLFSRGAAILSLKRVKPSVFFRAHIPNGVAG